MYCNRMLLPYNLNPRAVSGFSKSFHHIGFLEVQSFQNAGVAQWLERHVANVNVDGSNPFTRFSLAGVTSNASHQVYLPAFLENV